ncbi:uncharacterized protein VTP21DRAFT_4604 [Calcarisporiella thermophila]|uniref:uncharacterized protein n=1 Tax=Calcarisporiella thermophila TaxID=911321 RepID=UPI003742E358
MHRDSARDQLYGPYTMTSEHYSLSSLRVSRVKTSKYSTSLDSRGFIPVFEYTIGEHLIMWDRETGEIHFTGIWKALGRAKSEIVKMVDANPRLQVKRIRGGLLNIQGTWIPRESCRVLASRCCYSLRYELIPLFGPDFPDECIHPSQPEYGKLVLNDQKTTTLVHSKRKKQPSVSSHSNVQDDGESYLRGKEDDSLRKGAVSQNLKDDSSRSPKRSKLNSPRGMEQLLNYEENSSPSLKSLSRSRSSFSQRKLSQSLSPTQSPLLSPMTLGNSFSPSSSISTISNGLQEAQDNSSIKSGSSFYKSPVTLIPAGPFTYPTNNPGVNLSNDLIDTITATILLQRLSQDDGCRPFRPWQETKLPRTINVAGREFSVVWME